MKKLFTVLILFITIGSAFSQPSFQKGDVLVSAGTAFIFYRNLENADTYRAGVTVPAIVNAELALNNIISMGPYAAFTHRKFKNIQSIQNAEDDFVYNTYFYNVGLRTTLHIGPSLERLTGAFLHTDEVDYYITTLVGYELRTYEKELYPNKEELTAGLNAGFRYYFSPVWGLFGEVGLGVVGVATVGITGRF